MRRNLTAKLAKSAEILIGLISLYPTKKNFANIAVKCFGLLTSRNTRGGTKDTMDVRKYLRTLRPLRLMLRITQTQSGQR